MFGEKINSVAILDLFNRISMGFKLRKLAFFKSIPNLKNPFNKLYNIVAIKKVFNIIILNFLIILLSLDIFDSLLTKFKNRRIIIKIGGGGKKATA